MTRRYFLGNTKKMVLVYLSEARCPSARYGLTNSKEIKVTILRRELQTGK